MSAGARDVLPRCGDHVHHAPSDETWVVAWADAEHLAWAGWPDGIARTADCAIIKRATDAEHRAAVEQWSRSTSERRRLRVMSMYGAALPTPTTEADDGR